MVTCCSRCAGLEAELANERARGASLAKELEETRRQRNEALKLVELEKADLERYRQVVHGQPQPNQPERTPDEQMQLAFARVLAAITDKKLVAQLQAAEDAALAASGNTKGPRVGHGRRRLDLTKLLVVEERITPAEVLAVNGEGWELIGLEPSDRLGFRPSTYVCIRIIREKWRLKVAVVAPPAATVDTAATSADSQTAIVEPQTATMAAQTVPSQAASTSSDAMLEIVPGAIVTAPIPDHVWPNVMADPSVIAEVVLSKYDYLLPLYRQERWTRNRGFVIPRSTQCDWIGGAFEYVKFIVDAMHAESIASAHCIATDATGAPVRAPGRCLNWHVFVFIGDDGHITFRHARRHTNAAIDGLLTGFKGHLLADASSIYDALAAHGIILVACWAHVRRYLWRAIETESELAFEGLAIIKRLFAVERAAKDVPMPERTTYRAERAAPVLALFDAWVARVRDRVEPRGRLAAAIKYYDNQRTALRRFLEDGRLPIDNNRSERQLRHLVGGRDNWKFFESESGLEWYTTFRSLIASCEVNDLNPHEYLEPVLRLLPHWPKHRVLELSPKYWRRTLEKLDERQTAGHHRPEMEARGPAAARHRRRIVEHILALTTPRQSPSPMGRPTPPSSSRSTPAPPRTRAHRSTRTPARAPSVRTSEARERTLRSIAASARDKARCRSARTAQRTPSADKDRVGRNGSRCSTRAPAHHRATLASPHRPTCRRTVPATA